MSRAAWGDGETHVFLPVIERCRNDPNAEVRAAATAALARIAAAAEHRRRSN